MDGMMSDELHANGSLVKDGHTEGKDLREDEANRYFRLVNNMVGGKAQRTELRARFMS